MLTAKENLLACIRGGTPDRFANQFEAFRLLIHPALLHHPEPETGEFTYTDAWGITYRCPVNTPYRIPVHTPDRLVLRDIVHWREYVHAPPLKIPEEEWAKWGEQYDSSDGAKALRAVFVTPGLFELCHHLGELANTLRNLAEYPRKMRDLIRYLTEYELRLAEKICDCLKPDTLFFHDVWGSARSTFLAPAVFEEFFVEPYRELYRYYRSRNVGLIVHHSCGYAASLVPDMIEMGIDIWQGCFSCNNLPELIRMYGGRISFMGGLESSLVDYEGWTRGEIRSVVEQTLTACGNRYFIPCITQSLPGSTFDGAYTAVCEEIDQYNAAHFGHSRRELEDARLPRSIPTEAENHSGI